MEYYLALLHLFRSEPASHEFSKAGLRIAKFLTDGIGCAFDGGAGLFNLFFDFICDRVYSLFLELSNDAPNGKKNNANEKEESNIKPRDEQRIRPCDLFDFCRIGED